MGSGCGDAIVSITCWIPWPILQVGYVWEATKEGIKDGLVRDAMQAAYD